MQHFYFVCFRIFFFTDTATTKIYTLSLHDALPIYETESGDHGVARKIHVRAVLDFTRSEEHTSELQSRQYLVCRLLLEKKNTNTELSTPHYLSTETHVPNTSSPLRTTMISTGYLMF